MSEEAFPGSPIMSRPAAAAPLSPASRRARAVETLGALDASDEAVIKAIGTLAEPATGAGVRLSAPFCAALGSRLRHSLSDTGRLSVAKRTMHLFMNAVGTAPLEIEQPEIGALVVQLLERLVDENLCDFGADNSQHLLQTLNVIMLKLLQHAPRSATICALLELLCERCERAAAQPREVAASSQETNLFPLLVKCFNKLSKTFQLDEAHSHLKHLELEPVVRQLERLHARLDPLRTPADARAAAGPAPARAAEVIEAADAMLQALVRHRGEEVLAAVRAAAAHAAAEAAGAARTSAGRTPKSTRKQGAAGAADAQQSQLERRVLALIGPTEPSSPVAETMNSPAAAAAARGISAVRGSSSQRKSRAAPEGPSPAKATQQPAAERPSPAAKAKQPSAEPPPAAAAPRTPGSLRKDAAAPAKAQPSPAKARPSPAKARPSPAKAQPSRRTPQSTHAKARTEAETGGAKAEAAARPLLAPAPKAEPLMRAQDARRPVGSDSEAAAAAPPPRVETGDAQPAEKTSGGDPIGSAMARLAAMKAKYNIQTPGRPATRRAAPVEEAAPSQPAEPPTGDVSCDVDSIRARIAGLRAQAGRTPGQAGRTPGQAGRTPGRRE